MVIRLHRGLRLESTTIGMSNWHSCLADSLANIFISDIVDCDLQQWIDVEDGIAGGTIHTLLDLEKASVSNNLIGLYHGKFTFPGMATGIRSNRNQIRTCSTSLIFAVLT